MLSSSIRILARSTRNVPRVLNRFPQVVRYHSTKLDKNLSETEKLKRQAQEWADNLQRDWDAKIIGYDRVKDKALRPSPDTFLIDVREPDEVIQGMIPSAVNVPLSVLAPSLGMPAEDFLQKFGFNKPKKDQEVIFYCRSGKRSTSASDVAKRNGYTNILNYKGSWMEWVSKDGKP